MKTFNLESDPDLVSKGGFTFDQGYEECLKILSLPQPPTALLISGNRITFGALRAIVEKNLKIPDDISIIGFTDSIVTPYLISPLTTVTHPLRDMGVRAFQLLLQHMDSRETLPFSRIVVQTKMRLGSSTASVNGELLHA